MFCIPATLKIYPEDLNEENVIASAIFVVGIPRIGESLHITIDNHQNRRVYAVTAVTDIIHIPSMSLNRFPKVIIEVRILREETLSPSVKN